MSKGTLLCVLVLLQACVLLHLPLITTSSSRLSGAPIVGGGVFLLCQDPIRRSCLMLSRGPDDEFDGADSDSILDGDRVLVRGDEYASNVGGTSFPGFEAVAEEEVDLLPWSDDDDGGGKESSGELGSGGDVECPECGKFFRNDKSMFGHLRSHPNRGYKGSTPPEKKLKLPSPGTDDVPGSPASSLPDIDGSSGKCSGRDPQLTPFEIFCACIMHTLRGRDSQAAEQVPPRPPSFDEEKLDVVDEQIDVGIGGLLTGNVAAEVKSEDTGPEVGNALLCDKHDGSIVKIPKKRRRSISKEDREANKKAKVVTITKEKRPYMCKHCKAEFSTHQALGGHMAGHHREKKIAALNTRETLKEHQGMVGQSQKGKQANGGDESWRSGLSLSSRRMQVEQLSMASNMSWLSGGHMKLDFVRRNDGTPPVPVATDVDRRRSLNIDLNVEAPEQD